MSITSKVSDDGLQVSIKVDGRFDFTAHTAFREAYSNTNTERASFLIDMSDTEYIDSAALGMLLLLREQAGGDNARIKISGCTQDVQRILQVSSFHKLFEIEEATA